MGQDKRYFGSAFWVVACVQLPLVELADGSVKFLSDEIPYWLYAQLMTPHGWNAREPGPKDPTRPTDFTRDLDPQYEWVGKLINEADLR